MEDIKHNEMVRVLAKGGEDIITGLTPESAHLLHMAVGMCGEASELLEAMIDIEEYEVIDKKNICEELGDFEFYLEGFRQGLGIDRDHILSLGIYKTAEFVDLDKMKYAVVSLSMYAGIVLDNIKKVAMYGKEINIDSVSQNLYSIEKCLCVTRKAFSLSHETVLRGNIKKLGKRYEGFVYSDKKAIDRADKSE